MSIISAWLKANEHAKFILLELLQVDSAWISAASDGAVHPDPDGICRSMGASFPTKKLVEILESKYTDKDVVLAIENLRASRNGFRNLLAGVSREIGKLVKSTEEVAELANRPVES